MAEQDTLSRNAKKFLFDIHDFDDDRKEEEVEDLPPPPPTFSEDELAQAKHESFTAGREAGVTESDAKRSKHVAAVLDSINQNFSTLFTAESEREDRYEAEALMLAQTIFARLFPGMNEKNGLEEVRRVILNVLETARGRPQIIIEVPQDYVEDIEKSLEMLASNLGDKGNWTVRAGTGLGPGDCRLQWNDGGAHRNIGGLAEQIEAELQQMLADRPGLRDNGETENEKDPEL